MDFALENWTSKHAHAPGIISMSLGGYYSSVENTTVKKLHDAGMLVVVAAGNANKDACNGSPSSAPDAFTVGATDIDDSRAVFSEYGDCVNVFAPGVQIYSTLPKNSHGYLSGTSMATPFVAGYCAYVSTILVGKIKDVTPDDVRFVVQCNGDQDIVTDSKTTVGNNIPFDNLTGFNPKVAYCTRYKKANPEKYEKLLSIF
jgi:subtilisin family serine protease